MITVKGLTEPRTCDGCHFYDDIARYCDAKSRRIYKVDGPRPRWCPVGNAKNLVDIEMATECAHREMRYEADGKVKPKDFYDGFNAAIRGIYKTPRAGDK